MKIPLLLFITIVLICSCGDGGKQRRMDTYAEKLDSLETAISEDRKDSLALTDSILQVSHMKDLQYARFDTLKDSLRQCIYGDLVAAYFIYENHKDLMTIMQDWKDAFDNGELKLQLLKYAGEAAYTYLFPGVIDSMERKIRSLGSRQNVCMQRVEAFQNELAGLKKSLTLCGITLEGLRDEKFVYQERISQLKDD